ncbi:tetratricopeptide repeat protein [Nocardia lijiangensis]|uniref:tetratricopeptide repeat protein n=1 Tax=Nocardia lijiangensis TaxID=299618 RepID=UPI000831FEAA|nr:tetratricopeptide repeat protein [Nocardia lijiangensis]
MSELLSRTLRKPRLILFVLAATIAAALGVTAALPDDSPAAQPATTDPSDPSGPLVAQITQARQQLDRVPGNAIGWAGLGAAYVELARVTGDPENYGEAQRALDRSLELKPEGNAEALTGLGALANARHDFIPARRYAEQALALRPDSADVYGVLIDALTQLGEADAASAAVQRMLDLRPGVPSFTRAAYDLELRGRTDEARQALQMALNAANTADQIAFCRYHLGELAFHTGNLDEAESHYRSGLLANPADAALQQGMAKTYAARGDLDRAIAEYTALTVSAPLPEYLIELGELFEAAGRPDEAAAKYREVSDQFRRLEEQGATEYVDAAQLAAEHGDPVEAVRLAQLEFGRRQSVITSDVLAWSLHKAGRDAEAIVYADRAAALGWRSATLAYHRGMILAALGEADQAAGALSEALRINPYFSPLHAPRARQALEALGAR